MQTHFLRGSLLLQQGRYADAIAEFQRQLLESPDDSTTHSLVSLCYTATEKFDEAMEHAQKAITLDPESAMGFQALGRCFLARNRLKEARESVEAALRLEPDDADHWALLSQIHLMLRDWRAALENADRGLTIEPEHPDCTNLRAQALVQLGDRAAAAQTMDAALSVSPDNSWTHANMGWSLLHANDPKKAMEHFREALRLDPNNEWARAGIVEAMQARNFIYRYLLQYFLWAGRLPSSWQWGLMLGGFIGNRFLNELASQNPPLRPFVYPIIGAYLCFAILTWLGPSFFNLLLRFDRFGRHALSRDQVWGANLLAIEIIPPLALVIIAGLVQRVEPLFVAIPWALLMIPSSLIFRCEKGWPRELMAAGTGLMGVVNLLITLPLIGLTGIVAPKIVWDCIKIGNELGGEAFIYVFVGLQFLGAYLVSVRVKK